MKILDYIEESKRTSAYDSLAHSALGVGGETREIVEILQVKNLNNLKNSEQLKEELGDLMWYVAMGYRASGFVPNITLVSPYVTLYYYSAKYMEHVKKYIFNDRNDEKGLVHFSLNQLYSYCSQFKNIPFEDILDYNIEKLYKRYPDGYSHENAKNRLDKNERNDDDK